jgi:hypothetical protein
VPLPKKKGKLAPIADGDAAALLTDTRVGRSEWTAIVPEEEFAIYNKAIKAIRPLNFPFMLGGAFGIASHTGRWRNTKDIDFFVLPEHHNAFIEVLLKNGFHDYYETLEYDRGWIFRAIQEGILVDIIWDTPNRRAHVDQQWIDRALSINFRGESMLAVPAEELIFIKAFVLQKDRCDWTDIINVLHFQAGHLDWEHIIRRFGPELPILRAILNVFAWVCPIEALQIPEKIRGDLNIEIQLPEDSAEHTRTRVKILDSRPWDSRPWFAAYQPMDKPMTL